MKPLTMEDVDSLEKIGGVPTYSLLRATVEAKEKAEALARQLGEALDALRETYCATECLPNLGAGRHLKKCEDARAALREAGL